MTPTPYAVHLAATITPGLVDHADAHRLGTDIAAEATRRHSAPCRLVLTGHSAAQPEHVDWTFSYRPDDDGHHQLGGFATITEQVAQLVAAQRIGAHLFAEELQAMTQARVDAEFARLSEPLDMVGIDEFRELLGVPGGVALSRSRFYQLRDSDDEFPWPVRRGIWLGHMARGYAAKRKG